MWRWCLLLLPLHAMADEARFDVDWQDGTQLRTIAEWDVSITDPAGETTSVSGLVHAMWRVGKTEAGWQLSSADGRVARVTPLGDALGTAVSGALAASWTLELDAAASSPSSTSEDAGDATEAVPGAITPMEPGGQEQVLAWVVTSPDEMYARVFEGLDGNTLVPGSTYRSEEGSTPAVTRLVQDLPGCPSEGPAKKCVSFEVVETHDGATAEAVPEGGRRVRDVWVLERDGLLPQRGTTTVQTTWLAKDAKGKEGTWRMTATREVRFLPDAPPADVSR